MTHGPCRASPVAMAPNFNMSSTLLGLKSTRVLTGPTPTRPLSPVYHPYGVTTKRQRAESADGGACADSGVVTIRKEMAHPRASQTCSTGRRILVSPRSWREGSVTGSPLDMGPTAGRLAARASVRRRLRARHRQAVVFATRGTVGV